MKRAGFTMIELIFVIVILGILAAVALPKFAGVASQAQVGKMKAFTGTMNRTVSPALWSEAINLTQGSVSAVVVADLNEQIELPTNVGDSAATDLTLAVPATPFSGCTAPGSLSNPATDAELAALGDFATVTIDGTVYTVVCQDGSMSQSPRFALKDAAGVVYAK